MNTYEEDMLEADSNAPRCEGWRRYGGAFSLGPIEWKQCAEDGVVLITFVEKGREQTLPACMDCWKECIRTGVDIIKVVPI